MQESPAQHFADCCHRGTLAYQWDPATRQAVFYPRVLPGLEWRESAGLGTVYATTVVRRRGEPPHNVALIDLDEGFRMMSRVEGTAPEDVRIGMRVRVAFDPDGVPIFAAA
jgi:uncharacterized protein